MKWSQPTDSKYARQRERRRIRVLDRSGWACHYCGCPLMLHSVLGEDLRWWGENGHLWPMTIEHLVPQALGGKNTPDNLVAACFGCNQKEGPHPSIPSGVPHGAGMFVEYEGKRYRREGRRWVEVAP